MSGKETKGVLHAWLNLIRPPNLVTIPGDPLAGFLTATSSAGSNIDVVNALACVVSALFLYISGLILNDVADYREDLRERPERPLPSGKISHRLALSVGLLGLVCGVACAGIAGVLSAATALGIALLVLLYNFVTRRWAWLGFFNMGACRGASVVLGASAVGINPMWSFNVLKAVACVVVYVMYISVVAYRETEDRSASARVGRLIRGLLVLQALLCAVTGLPGVIAGVCLLSMWPLGIVLSKRYYAS